MLDQDESRRQPINEWYKKLLEEDHEFEYGDISSAIWAPVYWENRDNDQIKRHAISSLIGLVDIDNGQKPRDPFSPDVLFINNLSKRSYADGQESILRWIVKNIGKTLAYKIYHELNVDSFYTDEETLDDFDPDRHY